MKTYMAKPGEVEQKWHVVDATDQIVGRLASRIAVMLMGKHRPTYTPHVDTGDFVVVVNAEKGRSSPARSGNRKSTAGTRAIRASGRSRPKRGWSASRS